MPRLEHQGISFNYEVEGEGLPLLMLHGLGGDLTQPQALLGLVAGYRHIYMDCRGHGATTPLGPHHLINFDQLADDVVELVFKLHIEYPILGGISMGAGICANIAVRYPGLPRVIVLVRPAWLDKPNPSNLAVFPQIACLLQQRGPENGKRWFELLPEYRRVGEVSPAAAESLLAQFDSPLAVERSVRLERMPRSSPVLCMEDCRKIICPTLVVGTATDPIHPFEFAHRWASAIPSAQLVQIPAKSVDPSAHVLEFRESLRRFLTRSSCT